MSAAAPFRLASHLMAYPEAAFLARLRSGIDECESGELRRGGETWSDLAALCRALHERDLDGLRSDHLELFARAADENPMSETEYGAPGAALASDLADIAGFYLAFDNGGLRDQLAVELEFYGWLAAREEQLGTLGDRSGAEAVRDGRRKFLCQHLRSFAASVAGRPEVSRHRFYGPALAWCVALVQRECRALGLEPPLVTHRRQARDVPAQLNAAS